MNIKPETIELWDWFNIQAELCTRMSISEEHFRAYQAELDDRSAIVLTDRCLTYVV